MNVLLWLLCIALQFAVFTAFGEWIAMRLFAWRPVRQGVPEFSYCLGMAGYLLTGAVVLPIALSARSVPVAVVVVAAALHVYGRRDSRPLPEALLQFAAFRKTKAWRASLALLILFAAAVSAPRFPWLLGLTSGTPIFDDVRTIGFPLALAAEGFPLRSPIAMEMLLPYAVAPFTWSAAAIAWLPAIALPFLLADVVAQTLFYGFTVLLLACAFVTAPAARLLLAATAFFGASINLWDLGIKAQWGWVYYFYGYFKLNQLYTTIGWDPMRGLVWIPNHALGLSAILLAVLSFTALRERRLALIFSLFSAVSSLDMTAMGLAAIGLLTAPSLIRLILQRRAPADWVWPVIRICTAAAGTLILVNLPSLTGRVDSPYDPVFPIITVPQFNAGMSSSHYGLYVLLFLAVVLIWKPPTAFRTLWLIPLLTGLIFSWAFEYHSIWFWRFTFAGHLLFGMWFAIHYPATRTRLYTILWTAILLAGVGQMGINLAFVPKQGPFATPDKTAAIGWIETHTPIHAKVADFRPAEANLVADPGFLRTGNRAGVRPYDRSHALIGYQDYIHKFSYLHSGIVANDYVIAPRSAREFLSVIEECGAAVTFANSTEAVYQVTPACRKILTGETRQRKYISWSGQLALRAAVARDTNPEKLETPLLAEYVILHPEAMWALRNRMDQLWGKSKADEAARILQPVVEAHPELAEAHYSYAFSLGISGLDKEKAIQHYTKALDLGYAEFWVRYNRGATFLALNRYAEARADLERALALDPKHQDVRTMLARIPPGANR
ncbi:MAG: tetratricopeptide repeat protein [Bryobacteraceae bacterium]